MALMFITVTRCLFTLPDRGKPAAMRTLSGYWVLGICQAKQQISRRNQTEAANMATLFSRKTCYNLTKLRRSLL